MSRRLKNAVDVKILGNWKGAVVAYSRMRPEIRRSILNGQRRYARKLVKVVKGHIMSQDLPWAPASQSKRGAQLMVDTGDYYTSIRYWQKNYELYVGVPKHLIHARSGKPLWKVASWQEYGTTKIPARPLWGPSIQEIGGVEQCFVEVKDELFSKLRATGLGIWEIFEV